MCSNELISKDIIQNARECSKVSRKDCQNEADISVNTEPGITYLRILLSSPVKIMLKIIPLPYFLECVQFLYRVQCDTNV